MFKKIASTVLAITMAASVAAIPASAEAFNPKMQTNNAAYVQPRTASWEVTGNLVRMRTEPSLSGTVIMLLERGEIVYEAAGYDHVEADGYTWVCVTCNRTGWGGWVATEYLNCLDY